MNPADKDKVLAALDALSAEDFRMGRAWERAHELAQAHESEKIFDRLHALCHRIEGDAFNAGYWYRKAGIAPATGSFLDEAVELRAALD